MRVMALKTFSSGGKVREPGEEFDTDQGRAHAYERKGMALLVFDTKPISTAKDPKPNAAAASGPLASAGGQIGAVEPPSSSPADPAPQTPTSPAPRARRSSSRSMSPGV